MPASCSACLASRSDHVSSQGRHLQPRARSTLAEAPAGERELTPEAVVNALPAICTLLAEDSHTLAGETFAATSAEYFSLKQQLESESFAPEVPGGPPRFYSQLPHEQRAKLLKERLKKYTQRVRSSTYPAMNSLQLVYLP